MFNFPWGFGRPIGQVLESVIAGLWFILVFVVIVGVLVILVRFLLVATKAAQLYLDRHSPVPVVPPEPVQDSPSSVVAPASSAPSSVTPPTAPTTPLPPMAAPPTPLPPTVLPPTAEKPSRPRAPRAPRPPSS